MTKHVSLKPSDAVRSSLLELISINRFAPRRSVSEMKDLYHPIRSLPRSVKSGIEAASNDSAVGKGSRELSRFLMLDALRVLEETPEISKIKQVKKDLIKIGKNLDGALRTHLEVRIKGYALYEPIYPLPDAEWTLLWFWDEENKDVTTGILGSIGFPATFLGVMIAASLLTLDEGILGSINKDLQTEYDMGIRDLRQYLTNLEFMRSEFT